MPYPTDNWTWEEFEEKARAIGKLPECYGAEFQVWPHFLRLFLWNHGLDVLSPDLSACLTTDPAVIRAGLVRSLGASIGAAQVDSRIAYLTADTLVPTPFARVWPVLRHGRFHLKTLNRWLRGLGAGDVVVKKRGSAIEPEPFRRRLATTPGGPTLTVFLTRVRDRPWMIVGADSVLPRRRAPAGRARADRPA